MKMCDDKKKKEKEKKKNSPRVRPPYIAQIAKLLDAQTSKESVGGVVISGTDFFSSTPCRLSLNALPFYFSIASSELFAIVLLPG